MVNETEAEKFPVNRSRGIQSDTSTLQMLVEEDKQTSPNLKYQDSDHFKYWNYTRDIPTADLTIIPLLVPD